MTTELWPLALAGCCFVAALNPFPVPVWVALSLLVLMMVRARPFPLVIATALLCSALSSQAAEGLKHPLPERFDGVVQLVTDPVLERGTVTADARSSLGRLRVVAETGVSSSLSAASAGDRFVASGRISPLTRETPWRHLRGQLLVDHIGDGPSMLPLVSVVTSLRNTIRQGAIGLPERLRPIELGFVIGDDRGASAVVQADFEEAGLAHLMVVSGENLGFLMVLARPLLRRAGLRRRFLTVATLLALFAATTRFEPSVLRATAMAAVLAICILIGRPIGAIRVLCLAVTALVLIDPLIALSLGFRLSVAATAGIVVLAPRIARALPGPSTLGLAIAVPIAAQIGVSPIALGAFGPPSLLAVPANVLAAPAAAFVMMWGSTIGVLAGLVPAGAAAVLLWPNRVALGWVVGVAELAADQRLVPVAVISTVVGIIALLVLGMIRRRDRSALLVIVVMLVGLAVPLAPVLGSAPGPRLGGCVELTGARVCRSSDSQRATAVTLGGDVDVVDLLGSLRSRGISRIDLLVRTTRSASASTAVDQVRERFDVRRVVSPESWSEDSANLRSPVVLGTLTVAIRSTRGALDVSIDDGSDRS